LEIKDQMILTDPNWEGLEGGYRIPYDPRPAMAKLSAGLDVAKAWAELWSELHHQGAVGEASYAAITILANLYSGEHQLDWNLFALAATIEVERHRKTNPPLPEWLKSDYEKAWIKLASLALDSLREGPDSTTLQASLAVLAIARGGLKLGALIINLDSSELDELLEQHLAWQSHYS
jgi:hypothetical protein